MVRIYSALHSLVSSTPSSTMSNTRNTSWCILIRKYFRVHFQGEEVGDGKTCRWALCERKSWSLIQLLLLYLPGIAHGSVHDEIRRGMLYQAWSRWKLCFAVCSSVRSGADINLTSYEVCLKSSANANAQQRQMTLAELNSYLAVTFHGAWYTWERNNTNVK